MKRLILFFALATMLASCSINSVQETSQVVTLTARAQDWVVNTHPADNSPLYYSCTFDMPEITSSVFSQGSVQTYIYVDNKQQALPYVLHFKNLLGETWTRTIDCEYGVGFLTIFYTNSDFSTTDAPATLDFRVVVTK